MENCIELLKKLESGQMTLDEQVDAINTIKLALHEISPFKGEPVDCVIWVKNDKAVANDYNPNKVAPPEMELLEISILHDWYTQPVVTWENHDNYEIIDWFHRNRVAKESETVRERVKWYLPIVNIRKSQEDKNDRIASTIRHNRARGKHQIDAMSEIVIELKNRNWKNERIAKELWMDEEEVLRLLQITWLSDLFKDSDFSNSWNAEDSIDNYVDLTDNVDEIINEYRIANVDDEERIFHTYDKWECHKAGFYGTKKEWNTASECEQEYKNILSNQELFGSILEKVIVEWKNSCEHYLTNRAMNRIAWLWQAAVCYHSGIPSKFCGWWSLLTEKEQEEANETALKYLNVWLEQNWRNQITINEAISYEREANIY